MRQLQTLYLFTFFFLLLFLFPFSSVFPRAVHQLIYQICVFLLLLFSSLNTSAQKRTRRGWKKPRALHMAEAALLALCTLGAGLLLRPAELPPGMFSTSLPLLTAMAGLAALSEELFFRCWLLSEFTAAGFSFWHIACISSLVFASLHLWEGVSAALLACITGIIYCAAFRRWGSLWPLFTAHLLHNFAALLWNRLQV
ncbi:MAG: hypothetical protein CSA76_01440 [Spirochaetales bacterium]|nr:MAG: hypothetical protein CSA76_01440 [Spirochaetales bacterium]